MRKLIGLFALLTFVGLQVCFAQKREITGTVIDKNDQSPLPGVSIVIKGNPTQGTATNADGKFQLEVDENDILVFTFIGMKPQEIAVKGKTHLKIEMEPSAEALEEVMVVAYGTAKKSSFTGAAETVKGEKLAKMQTSNISKALDGAVSGVQITSNSGQPGSAATIRIRGLGSILASSDPLIVLDGVPYEGSLSSISQQDIESMTVLKDAAANSLYGARGANGVIMITTKKGKIGKASIAFENRTGWNMRGVPQYDVIESPKEYYELMWEALRNQSYYGGARSMAESGVYASQELIKVLGGYNNYDVPAQELVDPATGKLNPNAKLLYHDKWLDEAFSPGLRQENNLSISGGTEKSNYYASLNYLDDNSYTENSSFRRYGIRVKIDQELRPWLKAGFNLGYSNIKSNSPNVGGTNYSSIFYFGQTIAPIYPVYIYDEQGNKVYDSQGRPLYDYGVSMGKRPVGANANPIAQQKHDIRETTRDAVNAKVYGEIKFLKDFKLTINASVENFNTNSIDFQTPIGGDALNVNGRSTREMSRYFVFNANQLLTWARSFGLHNLDVLLGHETKQDQSTNVWARKENFLIPDNPELANAAKLSDANSGAGKYRLEGYFSRLQYNYNDKYYLSGSYRLDASSKFHPDVRWGNFWSVGAAWRINRENFLENVSFINNLKLKASYGTQGNDNVPNIIPYKDQYSVVPQDGAIGIVYTFRGNPNLEWEKSANFNAGIEFGFFDRISGSIEYFHKKTFDLLYAKPLPPSMGLPSSIWENSMKMTNEGVEIDLSADIIKNNNIRWNITINATHYKNKLKELPKDRDPKGWATGSYFRKKGGSLYNWYNYKWAGVDPTNGDPLYYTDVTDEEGNVTLGTVNSTENAKRYDLNKSPIPDLYGGFSTTLELYGFDFNASFAYQIGGWVYDSQYSSLMGGGSAGTNWHKDIYKRWTPDNPNAKIPRLHEGELDINGSSDRFLTKASYLSLRNVTLGYNFPKSWMNKIKLEGLRLYVTGDNLFLLSKRKGFDPRQSFTGDTGYAYSAMSTVSFGININF